MAKKTEKKKSTTITNFVDLDCDLKMAATGQMSRVVANEWLDHNESAKVEIEKATNARDVMDCVRKCEDKKADAAKAKTDKKNGA